MSPLIDVVFLLLIFFAVTTTFLEQAGMELELPESTSASPEEVSPTVVQVSSDGSVSFRGEEISPQVLESTIAGLDADERQRITVQADRRVEYGALVRILDALRRGGAAGLSLPMVPARDAAPIERPDDGQDRDPGATR